MSEILFTFSNQNRNFESVTGRRFFKNKLNYRYQIIFTPVNWDDYGFKTIFEVNAIDSHRRLGSHSKTISLGSVKIGYVGQEENTWTADNKLIEGRDLTRLSSDFFSMGVDSLYYENVNKFFDYDENIISMYYSKIRDIAYSKRILKKVEGELVFSTSFLRSTSYENIIYQYAGLLLRYRTAKIIKNEFSNLFVDGSGRKTLKPRLKMGISIRVDGEDLDFYLDKNDVFENNIYALIGSNGSGKSKLLDRIIGDYLNNEMEVNDLKNIVLVSFSPFDKLTSYREYKENKKNNRKSVRFIGLRDESNPDKYVDLDLSFFECLGNCLISEGKIGRLKIIIDNLYSDPIFKNSDIIKFINDALQRNSRNSNYYFDEKNVVNYFNMLSSGHKVVLYTTLKLVDLVDLNTLVLFDEPELYLHPPLLSSFIRTISDLFVENNAMGIITTHSPIVLQEIPSKYIRVIRKINDVNFYDNVNVKTFGESVDVLTNEIFKLEVYESGYYKLISDFFKKNKKRIVNFNQGYELFESHFKDELGIEAKKTVVSLLKNHLGKQD